ncbi:MAG: bifunctional folylpolyglutamate synthase/dihydrofolate synthase [Parvularculaceae bacterium]
MAALGSPHKRLPPTFHVAGTNGKGSTCAFLRALLEAGGERVHQFTSPHLVRYNERIVLAGAEISDRAFMDVLTRVDEAAGDDELTFFETLTCAGFLAFAETPADYLVLEVGLGGRLDATNVIERPAAAVVTAIGLDHQDWLGSDVATIAREKAGVFRADAPAVIGAQEPAAMAALVDAAEAANANAWPHGAVWTAHAENGRLVYQDENGLSDLAAPRLLGAHQFDNAGLAVAATKAAGLRLDDATLSRGIEGARHPARLQRLRRGPVVDALVAADGDEAWLDGGHNPHAAAALARAIGELEERSQKPLTLIVGMQKKKDARGFLAAFAGLAREIVAVKSSSDAAMDPVDIVSAARSAGVDATAAEDLGAAMKKARRSADGPTRFLICGSLHLAGDVLKHNA